MSEYKYKAFISYSHDDDRWANWLHRSLESYRPPKHLVGQVTDYGPIPKRMAPVFRDRDELSTATDLGKVLNESLAQSATQIIICSPAAARSRWVNEEILAFKRLGREERIFCIIVGGEPNADLASGEGLEECFPEALRYRLGPDGELSDVRAEPIAADLRPGKDGKNDGKLKLIAGMLGVGFDALKQREQQRRHRRMMLITGAATIGMVIATTLATVAIFARAEAERQRERAELEAETAKQTTQFMVELFNVSDPSEALGNTITAREILDRGARRIEFELDDQPAIKSTLLDTMGTVYMKLGLYGDASTLLRRGLDTRVALFGRNHPAVAQSQVGLGELLGRQSELEEAATLYTEALAAQRGSTDDAGAADIAATLVGLADIRTLQGRYEDSEALLREAIEIQRRVLGRNSLPLAKSLDDLGMIMWDQGRMDEIEPFLREGLAMRRQVVPGGIHPDITISLNNLAVFFYETGDFEQSTSLFREALDMSRKLLGDSHPAVATSLNNVANNLAMTAQDDDDYIEAEGYLQQALEIRLDQLGEDHPHVAQSYNNLAYLYIDTGDRQRALENARQAVSVYSAAYPGGHVERAWGMQNLAGLLIEESNYEEAEPLLRDALAMTLEFLDEEHPDVAITRTGMAVLLLRTAKAEDALEFASLAHDSLQDSMGSDHWRTAWARSAMGTALAQLDRYDEAEDLLLQSYDTLLNEPGASPFHIDSTRAALNSMYTAWGRPDDAARYGTEGSR